MGFRCDAATLARLEWPRLLEWLGREAATARGRAACIALAFPPTRAGARERLVETSEARALHDTGDAVPFGGVSDLGPALDDLARSAWIPANELGRVRDVLAGSRRCGDFLRARAERVPVLAALAASLPDLRGLERELERALTPEGELRDDASPELARLRREERECEREIERRMHVCLRDARIVPHLQDHYSTFREGRPVLPVRADARGHVRGIVHDVSASGTTVFIEPEGVVELSNRLRLARTRLEHEIERILRALGSEVAAERIALEALGDTLERLDVAQACGRLSARVDAVEPRISDPDAPAPPAAAAVRLEDLRHPLLLLEGGLAPEQIVANGVTLPEGVRGIVISGPNAGGKTVFAKAIGLAALSLRAGLHVACAPGSCFPAFDAVCAEIGDEQDLRSGLSTFSARMSNLAAILELARQTGPRTLVIADEVGEGTEPGEGAALAQAILEGLVGCGAFVVATTHFNRLKELAASDPRFANASAEFDPGSLLPTYRIHVGAPGSSGAMWVAERMGLERQVVERARGLLDRDDRKLESLTRSLSELRQELEAERRRAERLAEATEETRAEYARRLETLRSARAQALEAMRDELEVAYRAARAEIAGVVRTLQRGASDGRAANRAHARVERARLKVETAERAAAAPVQAAEAESIAGPDAPVDWERLEPGARLRLADLATPAVLLEKPDRRGLLSVRVGGARMRVPRSRVQGLVAGGAGMRPVPRVNVARLASPRGRSDEAGAAASECDLRGLRVDEALERADAHLHRLLGTGCPSIRFIHGHGTGALRSAIRAWLRDAPGVEDFAPGDPREGGNGVTIARLS